MSNSSKLAAAVVVGITASGCLYLLIRAGRGRREIIRITSLDELQQHSGLRGRITATLPWPKNGHQVAAVAVPNQGPALTAWPEGLLNLAPSLTQLNLSGACIATLPGQISRLQQLQDLDLGRNQLTSLPGEIGSLTALKYLNLMGNQLEGLPDSIGQLTALYRLGLKSNKLRALPRSIGGLSGLVELFITDNQLESLPAQMGQLKSLVKCQASFNEQLTSLPSEMGSLARLELLRVACCHIGELPPSFAGLTSLAWLSLASNPLTGCKPHTYGAAHLPAVKLEELQLGRKLGEGASGEVFQAEWRGQQVAVKVFQAEKSPDGHSRDEMAIAVALSSPNLIRMLGVLEEPLGLVMDLVQGKPLAEKPNFESLLRCRWAPGRAFSLDFVLKVALGLAGALEHMHYRGVAHGDVYAHNLLVDENGDAVYLCDYGASFFYKKGGPVPFEGQEVRSFGLLLNDLVQRLELPAEGPDAALSAQKELLQLVHAYTTGLPAQRPCFGAVGRQLRSIQKAYVKASRRGGSSGTTPSSTPRGE